MKYRSSVPLGRDWDDRTAAMMIPHHAAPRRKPAQNGREPDRRIGASWISGLSRVVTPCISTKSTHNNSATQTAVQDAHYAMSARALRGRSVLRGILGVRKRRLIFRLAPDFRVTAGVCADETECSGNSGHRVKPRHLSRSLACPLARSPARSIPPSPARYLPRPPAGRRFRRLGPLADAAATLLGALGDVVMNTWSAGWCRYEGCRVGWLCGAGGVVMNKCGGSPA
jgi:hypothetical protein